MKRADKINVIDQLFQLFQDGKWAEAANMFSPQAQIIRQYGKDIRIHTVTEFISSLKSGALSQVGIPEYINRKVSLLESDGFVEQHTTRLTIQGQTIELPVCIIGKFKDNGKIQKLEEYLDPSPIIKVLMQADK